MIQLIMIKYSWFYILYLSESMTRATADPVDHDKIHGFIFVRKYDKGHSKKCFCFIFVMMFNHDNI